MELFLNLAWVLCSLGLVWFWMRSCVSKRISLGTQLLALAMIVLLLLPVISLSDDLLAMQGPAETDMSLRRVLHVDEWHPSVVPATLMLPERAFEALLLGGVSHETLNEDRPAIAPAVDSRALDNRPPPAV